MIDLGRPAIPVTGARRALDGGATLERVWVGEGDPGLEVGLLSAERDLSAGVMRRAWDARRKGRAIPLLLLLPVSAGYRVCGPEGAPPPVRDLPADVVLTIIRRALALSADVVVDAVRAELARGIGSGGVPGVRNNGLVSTHYLLDKLPRSADWAGMMRVGERALQREGLDIFASLGYEVTAPTEGELLLRSGGAPLALAHVYRGAHLLDRFIDEVGTPAAAYVLARAKAHGAPYGILVAGPVARILSRTSSAQLGESAPSAAFLEVTTDLLPAARAGIIGACYAPDALRDGGHFTAVRAASERFAVGLRDRFRERVYSNVVPRLVRGIAHAARAQGVAVEPKLLYRATMLALFRTLFVLYAEDQNLLPVASPSYRPHSLTERIDGVRRTHEGRGFDARATDLWEDLTRIFKAIAEGHREWGVPAYDGGLFVDDPRTSPDGALLADLHIANVDFGPALHGLAVDKDPEGGFGKVDFGDLGVRHIGNLYEGLLSYEVAIADEDLGVDEGDPDQLYVPARAGQAIEVSRGEPYMRSPKGGRKASGSYYTPSFVVDRIIDRSVKPAFDRHLDALDDSDAARSAERLWDFKVCDPAMGSGHFLVSVVDAIAERISEFLYQHPLPAVRDELERARIAVLKASETAGAAEVAEVKDVDVLRRLVLKRCVYGVDLNPMAVELAQLSLWLHAFVPGLPLFYLGHTLRRGNSLVGTVGHELDSIRETMKETRSRATGTVAVSVQQAMFGTTFFTKIEGLLEPVRDIALSPDLELHEVERSRERQEELERLGSEVRPYLDAFAADPLDTGTVRERILHNEIDVNDPAPSRETRALLDRARRLCSELDAFHWWLAFPEVFLRERPGFDVVVANPPWEEVTVEELGYYARYVPGLKSEPSGKRQREKIAELAARHPDVLAGYERTLAETKQLRDYLKASFELTRSGDPDLYKAFAERFLTLARDGGAIGVVLPRSAFAGHGTEPFRARLFDNASAIRLDFLLNTRGWVFDDVHPQYTIALLAADVATGASAGLSVSGPADRPEAFAALDDHRVDWTAEELRAAEYAVPLMPNPAWASLFRHCYAVAPRFDADVSDWRAVPWSELHATNDRKSGLLAERATGWPVYSGDSFDLWKPEYKPPPFRLTERKGLAAMQAKREESSVWRREFPAAVVDDPTTLPQRRARILFRDVTNRLNARTAIACLVPPRVFAVNNSPSLLFPRGDERAQAYVLAVLCSLAFDWIVRRRVERHLNLYILCSLPFPRPAADDPRRIRLAALAARIACVDDRFADFAHANGVDCGPVSDTERDGYLEELDALVAHLFRMSETQLEIVFADFTEASVPIARRQAIRRHLSGMGTP